MMMKFTLILLLMVVSTFSLSKSIALSDSPGQEVKKPPETVVLAKASKLGQVTFSHVNHTTKNYSVDGTKPVVCVECHHTAQPLAEASKTHSHKTVWPADRTTTLTAELLEKDPNALGAKCSECHSAPDTKPKLLPALPQVKFEGSDEPTVLTAQQAFHRNCAGCHDDVVKARPTLAPAPPTSKKCVACHKKTAA